jgi:hypothetical protein
MIFIISFEHHLVLYQHIKVSNANTFISFAFLIIDIRNTTLSNENERYHFHFNTILKYKMLPKIIGISGKIGSGKDILAEYLVDLCLEITKKKYIKVAFADKVKILTAYLLSTPYGVQLTREGKASIIEIYSCVIFTVDLYDKNIKYTKTAINWWTVIGIRFGIMKDIRNIISKLIWQSRHEALYFLKG